ncbi:MULTISPECIES: hypothetical protein [Marispirochaeta]|uniref:DUF7706 family protein n=1 Tax=Marispirochaeta TaxID=1911565 RepID=UPI0029C716F7|nr:MULTISPECIES: hypothetical protein [Marispirochaeta]
MTIEITEQEARLLEAFLRRATFDDFRRRAESKEEAYRMIAAAEKLRAELRNM